MQKELGFFCPFPCCCLGMKAATSAILILLWDMIVTGALILYGYTYFKQQYALFGAIYIVILIFCLCSICIHNQFCFRCVTVILKYLYSGMLVLTGITLTIQALWVSQKPESMNVVTSRAQTRSELAWVLLGTGLVLIFLGTLSLFLAYALQLAIVVVEYEEEIYNGKRSHSTPPVASKQSIYSLPGRQVQSLQIYRV
eukprot:TRINITY_DN11776_c0_g1_i1.p1 TRINITY_DN11776_c0_g1~~TRINITY_DN11776_c0_g1_i1.p1  ORF type:complete len:198 (+),score=10.18 TRINITY_DN11776_c0_g1_i1:94-687(+)